MGTPWQLGVGSFPPYSLLPTHLPSPRELLGRGEGGGLGERSSSGGLLSQTPFATKPKPPPSPLPTPSLRRFPPGSQLGSQDGGWELSLPSLHLPSPRELLGSRELSSQGRLFPKENSVPNSVPNSVGNSLAVGSRELPSLLPTAYPPSLPQGASREFSFGKSLPISQLPALAVGRGEESSRKRTPYCLPTCAPLNLGSWEGGVGRFRSRGGEVA